MEPGAATPPGHLALFAGQLRVSGRFDALAAGCPPHNASPNALSKGDILGTKMPSILPDGGARRTSRRYAATGSMQRCWA